MKFIDKIITYLFVTLFFLTPLIYTTNTSELFEFNKMILIYLLTIFIAFFWLVKMILTKKILFRKTFLDIPILLFMLSQIFSTIFSLNSHVSFYGYYGRFNGGLLSIICYVILYFAFVSNRVSADTILKTTLFSSVFVMLYGLPGRLGHDLTCFIASSGRIFDNSCWSTETNIFNPAERTFSTLGQPNWMGAFLAINFFIGIYFLLRRIKTSRFAFLEFFYLLANFSFILFSRSRSALGSVIIGLVVLLTYYLFSFKKRFLKTFLFLTLVVIIPIIAFKTGVDRIDRYIVSPTSLFKRQISLKAVSKNEQSINSGVTESFDIRKIVWKGALDLGFKKPLFGSGVETFAYGYNFVRPVEHNLTSEWDYIYNKAHNEYLNYFATTGFVGFFSYSSLILTFLVSMTLRLFGKNAKLSRSADILALIVAYFSILFTNFFGFSTSTVNLFFYLIPAFVIALLDSGKESREDYSLKAIDGYDVFALLILVLITGYLVFATFSYWLADTYYASGSNYSKPAVQDYQRSAGDLEKALKFRNEPTYEDKLSSSLAYLSVYATYQKQNDLAKKIIDYSIRYNNDTLKKFPKNVYFLRTKAKNEYLFYQATSDAKYLLRGLDALKQAEDLSPTDPKMPYSMSIYYALLSDIESNKVKKDELRDLSLKMVDQSLLLKKDFQEAIVLKKELLSKYK